MSIKLFEVNRMNWFARNVILFGLIARLAMNGRIGLYVVNMMMKKYTLTLKESTNMKFVSHFKRICMYGEEGRLLIFFNRIYVFHSYQRFRWLLEITDS